MPATLHDELARAAESEGVSLNQLITGVLAGAVEWRFADAPPRDDDRRPPALRKDDVHPVRREPRAPRRRRDHRDLAARRRLGRPFALLYIWPPASTSSIRSRLVPDRPALRASGRTPTIPEQIARGGVPHECCDGHTRVASDIPLLDAKPATGGRLVLRRRRQSARVPTARRLARSAQPDRSARLDDGRGDGTVKLQKIRAPLRVAGGEGSRPRPRRPAHVDAVRRAAEVTLPTPPPARSLSAGFSLRTDPRGRAAARRCGDALLDRVLGR